MHIRGDIVARSWKVLVNRPRQRCSVSIILLFGGSTVNFPPQMISSSFNVLIGEHLTFIPICDIRRALRHNEDGGRG